jgi:predicted nucleotidyltransferase
MKLIKQSSEAEMRRILNMPEYVFPQKLFEENQHLNGEIALLCLGGSLSYGTNLPGKGDVDLRGVFVEHPHEIIGAKPNPQKVVDVESDTIMYSVNRIIELFLENNPNTLEILGTRPDHVFILNELGQKLIDNRKMFLSKRAIQSFNGYADDQFRRLENALARDRLSEDRKAYHVMKSMEKSLASFDAQFSLSPHGEASLYVEKGEGGNPEIVIDIDYKRFPVREFNSLMNVLTNVYRAYNKQNHRNNKKDDEHLDKHAMHLMRLYYMGIDILEKGEIITYREKEQELFREVRRGKFRRADGTYDDAFFDWKAEQEARFEYAAKHTELPDVADPEWVNEFIYECNKMILDRK